MVFFLLHVVCLLSFFSLEFHFRHSSPNDLRISVGSQQRRRWWSASCPMVVGYWCSPLFYFMEFFYWQNSSVPLKCVVRFLTGTNIAFANARWGYWAILVFCFFFAVTGVWWSLSTPSIILVQRSPLQRPAGGTGLYWFFDWRNKMACAEAAIANLATEPNRAASAACPHPPPSPKLMSLLFPSHSSGGRGSQSREGTEEGESGVVAITALQHGVMQKRSHRESSPPLMLSFVEV